MNSKEKRREYCRKWHHDNKERVNAEKRKYRQKYGEEVREQARKSYHKHKEKRKAENRKYHQENKQKRNEYSRKYHQEHKEEQLIKRAKFRQEHRERINKNQRKYHDNKFATLLRIEGFCQFDGCEIDNRYMLTLHHLFPGDKETVIILCRNHHELIDHRKEGFFDS